MDLLTSCERRELNASDRLCVVGKRLVQLRRRGPALALVAHKTFHSSLLHVCIELPLLAGL